MSYQPTGFEFVRTKKFGSLLKVLLLMLMPALLLLWPFAATMGAILTGLGFGIALPLIATFEAIREGVQNKFTSCFKVLILIFFPILFFFSISQLTLTNWHYFTCQSKDIGCPYDKCRLALGIRLKEGLPLFKTLRIFASIRISLLWMGYSRQRVRQ